MITSLRTRLLLGLLLALLLALALVFWVSWQAARSELASVFDAHLQQSAAIMLLWSQTEPRAGEQLDADKYRDELQSLLPLMTGVYLRRNSGVVRFDDRRELAYSILCDEPSSAAQSECMAVASPNAPALLSLPAAPGFAEQREDDAAATLWHIYTLHDAERGFTVRVAERDDVRRQLIAGMVWRQYGIMLSLIPLTGLLVWWVLGHGLRPLRQLSAQINARSANLLEPVVTSAPDEVSALVAALNQLLHKLAAALERERRFSADVAHELRTPLSVIKTRAELTSARVTDAAAASACSEISRQCQRATRVLDQLLQLAPIEGDQPQHWQQVDLAALTREVMADLAAPALARDVELVLHTADHDCSLQAQPVALSILLRNLLDNAIRHCDRAGEVTVAIGLQDQRLLLSVADQGPGLSADQRQQLQRFMHSAESSLVPPELRSDQSGYGLGLRIVQRIAALHAAEVRVLAGEQGGGLQVQLSFSLLRSVSRPQQLE